MTPSSSEASPTHLSGIKTNKSFHIKLAKNQQEIQRRKMLQDGGPNSSEGITSPYRLSDPINPTPQEIAYSLVVQQPLNRSGFIHKVKY